MAANRPGQTDDTKPLVRGGTLLVMATALCTVFAFLAGAEVGDQETMFLISFVFLGLLTVGIFALAAVDSRKRPDSPRDFQH